MGATRREFIQYSAAVGAAAAISPMALARQAGGAPKPMNILVLGGTAFLGPAYIEYALQRGHSVTMFNRGRTNDDMFGDRVQKLYGDRDPKNTDTKNIDAGEEPRWAEGEGLKSIEQAIADGQTWDAVYDTSGYYPRIVKASAELLAPVCQHYTYISSVSVYSDMTQTMKNEDAEIATMEDPTIESMGDQFQYYGPLKALCEQAAEAANPGHVANVRPGLIVGPRDRTDRFTYWPVRVQRGGEVLCPEGPDVGIQIIDVRDLAEWCVHLAERNVTGEFNALGPMPGELTMGQMLEASKKVSGSDAEFTWATPEFLQENQVAPWGQMPVWVPSEGAMAGFHAWDVSRPMAAGLTFRPIEDTVAATLEWWNGMSEEDRARHPMMQDPPRAGISAERETELLAKWHEQA